MSADHFFDSNVLIYLFSGDDTKADEAESLLSQGGVISVQVLNEFASVASRKAGMSTAEIREALEPIRAICAVHPLTEELHDLGMQLTERYQLSLYDAMIVGSALTAGCNTLFSEDMQDGQIIDRKLRIQNPFR